MRQVFVPSRGSLSCSPSVGPTIHDFSPSQPKPLFTLCEQSTHSPHSFLVSEHRLLSQPLSDHHNRAKAINHKPAPTMHFLTTAITAASLAALANAHGYFTKPAGRPPGAVFESACGQQAYYNMEGSINGNIQGLEQVVQNQPDYKPAECHLWKCKGLKYADNTANVQK